jgi:hypothetical protein
LSHILIEKAFKYKIPRQKENLLKNYFYDAIKGYWLNKSNGQALMLENNQFKPRTKKEDIETGEDRKGE